jgi:cysteine desulfurase
MAAAAEFVVQENQPSQGYGLAGENEKEKRLRDQLWRRIGQSFPDALRNGEATRCLGNTLNVSFPGFDSETMLMALDLEGVCASSGSACMVGSVVASHVLLAMGLSMERASSAVRFSLGKQTSTDEIDRAADAIDRIFNRLAKTKTKSSAYAVA